MDLGIPSLVAFLHQDSVRKYTGALRSSRPAGPNGDGLLDRLQVGCAGVVGGGGALRGGGGKSF